MFSLYDTQNFLAIDEFWRDELLRRVGEESNYGVCGILRVYKSGMEQAKIRSRLIKWHLSRPFIAKRLMLHSLCVSRLVYTLFWPVKMQRTVTRVLFTTRE